MADRVGSVMVVGGGIGGIQAAIDAAEAGFFVHLVTDSPSIGGKMAQWDKTFPTNDCAMCLLGPKMSECAGHPSIEIHTLSTVERVTGGPGNFEVTLRTKARYIDPKECTSCGSCAEVCPVERPDAFNLGLSRRKAVYKPFPQAIPNAFLIEKRGVSPCRMGCPAGVHTHGYVTLVAGGRYREAWSLIRRDNPFVSICGTVCHNPCEKVCQRGEFDQPIAIKALKAFLGHYILTKDREWAFQQAVPVEPRRAERVAVFGSGPAGLSCAYQLARRGYPVTVYEALPVAGGLMRVGIPEYRLPREFIDTEIELIRRMGVEIRTGVPVGEDLKISDVLAEGYKAVFVSVGAHQLKKSALPGQDLDGVHYGVSFLRKVNLGEQVRVGRRVAVVGGGYTAVDAARTAVRLGAEHVEVFFRGPERELYALPEDIAAARREGVVFTCLTTVVRVAGQQAAEGLELVRWRDVGVGRKPVPEHGSEHFVPFDTVILATSEVPLETFFDHDASLKRTEEGTIAVDPLTLATGLPGVFAGGDAVTGPGTIIDAIASGKRAAESIDRFINGRDLTEGRTRWPKLEEVARLTLDDRVIPHRPRVKPLAGAAGAGEAEVFGGYTEAMAREEASRCLDCGICAECMRCEEVCEKKAVRHDELDRGVTLKVGSIILTPGFSTFDPAKKGEFGYGYFPNVITSPELERLLSSTGPTGGSLRRPGDGKRPRRVAFIQCVGSRESPREGREWGLLSGPAGHVPAAYCSGICCMFAVKEALLIRERDHDVEVTIFNLDLRAYGKEFRRYADAAFDRYGVRLVNALVSGVKEDPCTGNLRLRYVPQAAGRTPGGRARPHGETGSPSAPVEEEFDMVVLAVGVQPPLAAEDLAQRIGFRLNEHGFAWTEARAPVATTKEGVFAAGGFLGPRDIPETITSASAAAAAAGGLLALARGEVTRTRSYPEERDVRGEDPRVGVFVCRCGINIASAVDVPTVVAEAGRLPGVVHAQDFLYTCSEDSLARIRETVVEKGLNRVVVAACTVRTHQPLFRDVLRQAGLNQFLFQMANIREQCSWVHKSDRDAATRKAKDLVRMAVAKARLLEPLKLFEVPVTPKALVIGGGPAGLTAALSLARQGFPSWIVERERELGGNLRWLRSTAEFADVGELRERLVREVDASRLIEVLTGFEVESFSGHAGHFTTVVRRVREGGRDGQAGECSGEDGVSECLTLEHGVVIVATGTEEGRVEGLGHGPILSRLDFEREMEDALARLSRPQPRVTFLLCAGGRGHGPAAGNTAPYCSRTCCTQAVKAALEVKALRPEADVHILYRDMVTYGFFESLYRQAREKGVVFTRFPEGRYPEIEEGRAAVPGREGAAAAPLVVRVTDASTGAELRLETDLVVLGTSAVPARGTADLARKLKVALTPDGFFSEVHAKLAPLDLPVSGVYVAGGAHGPKHLSETIMQAEGAAARAATVLAKTSLTTGGIVAQVDPEKCAACLTCVRVCPYNVPFINEDAVAEIDPVKCRGCGTCAGECPARAIELPYYKNNQLAAVVTELFRAVGE
ncbi:MAG: FAD-dependent oxidoreductase [Firmicutes bacterium]|nr:FAD-dependent oxidoreductase [Bacillota bacterium]